MFVLLKIHMPRRGFSKSRAESRVCFSPLVNDWIPRWLILSRMRSTSARTESGELMFTVLLTSGTPRERTRRHHAGSSISVRDDVHPRKSQRLNKR